MLNNQMCKQTTALLSKSDNSKELVVELNGHTNDMNSYANITYKITYTSNLDKGNAKINVKDIKINVEKD